MKVDRKAALKLLGVLSYKLADSYDNDRLGSMLTKIKEVPEQDLAVVMTGDDQESAELLREVLSAVEGGDAVEVDGDYTPPTEGGGSGQGEQVRGSGKTVEQAAVKEKARPKKQRTPRKKVETVKEKQKAKPAKEETVKTLTKPKKKIRRDDEVEAVEKKKPSKNGNGKPNRDKPEKKPARRSEPAELDAFGMREGTGAAEINKVLSRKTPKTEAEILEECGVDTPLSRIRGHMKKLEARGFVEKTPKGWKVVK